jgi:hypothetical protein
MARYGRRLTPVWPCRFGKRFETHPFDGIRLLLSQRFQKEQSAAEQITCRDLVAVCWGVRMARVQALTQEHTAWQRHDCAKRDGGHACGAGAQGVP